MSKAGIIMAVAVVVALVGAGAGVYFTPNENDTVEIEIKDLFEVGNKHIMLVELGGSGYVISDVDTVGGELRFDIDANEISDITYEELRENLLGMIIFEELGISATAGDEERTLTEFGDRDCIVYTQDNGNGSKDIYFVGKNNGVVYRQEHLVNDVVTGTTVLQKSSMLVESNTAVGLKDAEDIEICDSISIKSTNIITLAIEGVNLPDGGGDVTYDVRISGVVRGEPLTRDEILEEAGIAFSGSLEDDLVNAGIVIVDTPLGKVKCDAYENTILLGFFEITYYISDDVMVMNTGVIFGMELKMYWGYTDLVVAK